MSKKDSYKDNVNFTGEDTSIVPAAEMDFFKIINQQPDRVYRFVSKTVLDKSGGFDRRGWEVITSQNSKGERLASIFGTASSGTDVRQEDLVLCFMPKERMEQKRAMMRRRKDMLRNTMQELRNKVRRAGMPITGDVTIQRPGRSDQPGLDIL